MKALRRSFLIALIMYPMIGASVGAQPAENRALVQVFIFGLAVLHPDGSDSVVHFPNDGDHQLIVGEGDPNEPTINRSQPFNNLDLSLLIEEPTIAPSPTALDATPQSRDTPSSKKDASSAAWLLRAAEADGRSHTYVASPPDSRVSFERGVLETCGLSAESKKVNGKFSDSCRMKVENTARARTVSEVMVIRAEVEYSAVRKGKVIIECSSANCPGYFPVSIEPRKLEGCSNSPAACIEWTPPGSAQSKSYEFVADAFLYNVPASMRRNTHRIMSSSHVRQIKVRHDPMPPVMDRLIAPDCPDQDGNQECDCSFEQPVCWDYFSRYVGKTLVEMANGGPLEFSILVDVAACPMSGYP